MAIALPRGGFRAGWLRDLDYRRLFVTLLQYGLAGSIAAIFGSGLALGAAKLNVLLFGLLAAMAAFIIRIERLLWVLLILTYVVFGLLVYFAKIGAAFWLPYIVTVALTFRLPLERLKRLDGERVSPPFFFLPLIAFVVVMGTSAVVNRTPPLHLVVGMKNYVFVWGVLLVFWVARLEAGAIEKMWRFMFIVAVIQLPLTFVQHFFLSSRSWDAVVGSFGGDPDGGGASGAMAVFLTVVIVLVGALYKRGQIKPLRAAALCLACLISLLLAEVKIVFFLLPIAGLLLFRREFIRRPLIAVVGLLFAVLFSSLLFVGYQQLYYTQVKTGGDSQSYARYIVDVDAQTDFVNYQTGEVSRVAAPVIWWHFNRSDLGRMIIGHGVAASRQSSTIGAGDAARRYPFSLETSSLSVLLWDLGIAGLACFVLILLTGALKAASLAPRDEIPPFHRAVLDTAFVALLLFVATLPYNRDAVDGAPIQILIALMLGHVAYWHRQTAQHRTPHGH